MKIASNNIVTFVASESFLKLTFLWFIIQGLFFAATTKYGLPPDEMYHVSFMKLFAENNLSPFLSQQEGFYHLGEVVRTPFFLYHYLFSFIYVLVNSFDSFYILLRIINLLIGVASLFLVLKISNYVKVSKIARNLSLFMLTNTLMFVFLSASISYDNLFIFLSLACIFLLLRLLKRMDATYLLFFLVSLASGSLVKINFLPLAFIVTIIFIYRFGRDFTENKNSVINSFVSKFKINLLLSVLLAALLVLITHRFVYNIISYKSITPACTQVQSLNNCRKHSLFIRNESIYGADKRAAHLNLASYAFEWTPLMIDRTFGIFAHQRLHANKFIKGYVLTMLMISIVIIIRSLKMNNHFLNIVFIIAVFNLMVLFIENNSIYNNTGRASFAVHGRYMFAILPLLYILMNHYIIKSLKPRMYAIAIYVLVSLGLFSASSLPSYIKQTNFSWYNGTAQKLIRKF